MIKCSKCEEEFSPMKSYWRLCNECVRIPKMGCKTCGNEAKVSRLSNGEISVECCGFKENFYKKRPKSYTGPCPNGMFDPEDVSFFDPEFMRHF